MAVTAADFYTYAKETGTQIPGSKKEEAELVPVINRWKKNRLSIPRTESKEQYIERNEPNTGTLAGLAGIGALALAGFKRKELGQLARNLGDKIDTTSTNVGSIKKDLNVENIELGSEPPTPIAKKWVEQKAKQTPKTTVVQKVSPKPKPSEKEALNAYINQRIEEKSTGTRKDIADLQEGIRQEKLARGDKEISRGYFESDAKRQEQELARRGFNETDLPELEDQPAPGAPSPDDPASYSPRSYIESTGAVAPTKTGGMKRAPDGTLYDPTTGMTQDDIEWNAGIGKYEQPTLVEAKQNATPLIAEQAEEAIDTGFDQVIQRIDNAEQRDIDSVSLGKQNVEVGSINPEVSKVASSPIKIAGAGPFLREYTTLGSKIAGDTNIQRGNVPSGQLELPIVYSTRGRTNPTLRTQLVNEGPTYTSVDEYLERYKPAKEEILQSPLDADMKQARVMADLSQREEQLIKAGLKPGTTRFENALVAGWSAKPNIKQTITGQKFRENVVLPKEVEDYISTKIPETDASNVARDYYNPDTGDIQYPTVKGDAPITRDVYKERVIDNEELKNAASGTSIRGKSRSLDIQEPKVRTRTDEFTGDVRPDRIGGTLPIGGVPVEIDGQPAIISGPSKIEEANLRDAGLYPKVLDKTQYPNPQMAPQLSKQEVVQSIINPSPVSREDLTGGGAGMGVYGRQLGYVAGPNSKTAGTRPTQLPEGKYGKFNPTTQRDKFRGYSNEALRKRISDGTYRSGKVSPAAVEAQQELTLRQNLNYPENYTPTKQTTLDAMKVSDDIRKIYSSGRPDAQQQVDLYLKAQGAPQRPSTSFVVNEDVDLRGTPVKVGEQPIETSVTQTKFAQPLNYPSAQNQVTYVPPSNISVSPNEIEKAERMHLLNYISAAHGQIKGGARAAGTKMRNKLTPYQTPSDAMMNQLIRKGRMERI